MPWLSTRSLPQSSHAVVPVADNTQMKAPVYALQPSEALPSIDCAKTVKTLVIRNPRHLENYNWLTRRFKRQLNLSLALGCMTTWAFSFVRFKTSRILAIISLPLLTFPLSTGLMVMRFDLIRLLVATYEFWYIATNSALSTVLLGIYLGDVARSFLPVVTFICYISAFLVDANYSDVRGNVMSLVFGSISLSIFMVAVSLQIVPGIHNAKLFTYNGRILEARDVILNSLSVVLLLMVRNAYRKLTTKPTTTAARVLLIGFRTRIRFVEVSMNTTQAAISGSSTESHNISAGTLSQLQYSRQSDIFPSENVLIPWLFNSIKSEAMAMFILSRSALVLSIVASQIPREPAFAVAALLTTAAYCLLSLGLHHRAMQRTLFRSFDVLFLFAQHSFAHITAAYLDRWGQFCLIIGTSWLWVVWSLTIDAFTPVTKEKLAITRPFLLVVFAKQIFDEAVTSFNIVYNSVEHIDDRVILTVQLTTQHRIVVNAIPFLLTRLFSVFWWTWRLTWRVWTQRTGDLVVIQGGVEYEDSVLQQRLAKRQMKKTIG